MGRDRVLTGGTVDLESWMGGGGSSTEDVGRGRGCPLASLRRSGVEAVARHQRVEVEEWGSVACR
jgi:hypothetical protein